MGQSLCGMWAMTLGDSDRYCDDMMMSLVLLLTTSGPGHNISITPRWDKNFPVKAPGSRHRVLRTLGTLELELF